MGVIAAVLFAGMVNWLATLIITEGKIFQPVRDLAATKGEYVRYLASCYLCAGVWVGIIEAVFFAVMKVEQPWHAWVLLVANALLYKAIGHLIFIMQRLAEAVTNRINRSTS